MNKTSSFNIAGQNDKIESRIVVALERVSEAFRVLLWNESKENSLSPIQIQIIIFLHFHSPEKCKVSYLADEFNMTRATISDSVRVLLAKGLISKQSDTKDSRSFTIALTTKGKTVAQNASLFASSIEQPIETLSEDQKTAMLNGLLKLIYDLNKSGIITIQRMCLTCSNFQTDGQIHYCNLLETQLFEKDLRVDCPDHKIMD